MTADWPARRPPEKPEVDEAGDIEGTNHRATVDEPVHGATDSSAEIESEHPQGRGKARDRRPRAQIDP